LKVPVEPLLIRVDPAMPLCGSSRAASKLRQESLTPVTAEGIQSAPTEASFTAVDVETANADRANICQIGIVRFEKGAVADDWQSLVNPEDYFHPLNVFVHGIDGRAMAGAPTWPQVVQAVNSRIDGQVLVCLTAFDRMSLTRACAKYDISAPAVTGSIPHASRDAPGRRTAASVGQGCARWPTCCP
jgi:DNA polymerase III epsilon subunit-like protein